MRFLTLALVAATSTVQLGGCASSSAEPKETAQGYIVQLTATPLVSYTGGVAGLAPTSPEACGTDTVDLNSPASQAYLAYLKSQQAELITAMQDALGRSIKPVYRYYSAMDGFSVRLTPAEAARVAKLPGVASVHSDQAYRTLVPDAVAPIRPLRDHAGG